MMEGLHARIKAVVAVAKARLRLASAYQAMWDDPDGRLVLEDILRKAGVLSTPHVEGDPGTSAWLVGRQSLGLDVLQGLRFNEAQLVGLAREQQDGSMDDEG